MVAAFWDDMDEMARIMSSKDVNPATQLVFMLATLVLLCVTASKKGVYVETRTSNIANSVLRFLSVTIGAAYLGTGTVSLANWSSSGLDATALAPYLHVGVSLFVRGLAWLTLGSTVGVHRWKPFYFGKTIQIWYIVTFLTGTFDVISAALDLAHNGAEMSMEIGLALASWPVAALLLYSAAMDFNNNAYGNNTERLSEPLLLDDKEQLCVDGKLESSRNDEGVDSPFSAAGVFSRLTFAWLNPLLSEGGTGTLETADMPPLCRQDRAAENYNLFLRTFENQYAAANQACRKSPSIFWVLVSCYWRSFCLTGFFAFLKSLTVSLGPIAVNLFIDYAAGNRAFKYEGVALVAGLLSAKLVEVVSQRHWNFGDRRIGIQIRSALIAAIYQKEMRLSTEGNEWTMH